MGHEIGEKWGNKKSINTLKHFRASVFKEKKYTKICGSGNDRNTQYIPLSLINFIIVSAAGRAEGGDGAEA